MCFIFGQKSSGFEGFSRRFEGILSFTFAIAGDSSLLFVGTGGGTIEVFEIATGKKIGTYEIEDTRIRHVELSYGGKNLMVVYSNYSNNKDSHSKMMLNKSLKLEFYSGYNLKNERLEAGNYSFVVNEDGSLTISQLGCHINNLGIIDKTKKTPILLIEKISDSDLELWEFIGKGSSGYVQSGLYIPKRMPVALKTVRVFDKDQMGQVLNELKLHIEKNLKIISSGIGEYHYERNLTQLFSAFIDKHNQLKVVMELMDLGSLAGIMHLFRETKPPSSPLIEEKFISIITTQILRGIYVIHHVLKVIHRDLKPENILINSYGEVKVADFGVSKSVIGTYDKTSTFVGSMTHMSPERLERNFHSIKSDIWSLGIIVYEMLTGELPFDISQRKPCDLMNLWSSGRSPALRFGSIPVSPELQDFIGLCLEVTETKRASTEDLLRHPFITKHLTLENEQTYSSVFMRDVISLVLASRSKPMFPKVKMEEYLWPSNAMEEEAPTKGISDLSTTNEMDVREEDTILQE